MLQKVICASINIQHISSKFHYSWCSFITPEYILYFFKQSFFLSGIHFFKSFKWIPALMNVIEIHVLNGIEGFLFGSMIAWKGILVWCMKPVMILMIFANQTDLYKRTASSCPAKFDLVFSTSFFFFFLIGLLLLCWGFFVCFFNLAWICLVNHK